ncbi:SDR family oxidoreductase [Streptomyces spiramenti]|uniref:SDR family oxidoreductase n=1 Tax=Streptomyces spiramenti TaxID=2720606 RepID=A0ABX1ASG8_9ACTN|nr:SDR family oxidoreductase [Streptomyces spiramenti]
MTTDQDAGAAGAASPSPPTSDPPVIAITGAGRGLGLLTTAELLRRGSLVIANHRSESEELRLLTKEFPDRLVMLPGDIGEEATAVALAGAARKLGRLDAVVHNAGIARDEALVRMPAEDWDLVHRTNVRGAFLVTKHALRLMMRRRTGRMVYVSSVVAHTGNPGQAAYAASKSALQGLSQSVAQEYAPYNIRTVVVSPGLLDTGLATHIPDAHRSRLLSHSLGGETDARHTAALIAYLTTPESASINATVVRADGGIRY